MLARLIRWAREGSIATATVIAFASVPAVAQASWFDDIKDAGRALGAVFNPSHEIGKFALGSVMVGGGMAGIAAGEMAVAAGAAAIVGTAITGGAIVVIAVGLGLAVWGGYQLWKSFNGKDTPAPITPPSPNRPGGPTEPGRPGRIEPGRTSPGSGTPGTGTVPGSGSGTIGDSGSSTTPGGNVGRNERTTDLPGLRRPAPGSTGSSASSGGAAPAGRPR
jgi:hypothetical protein